MAGCPDAVGAVEGQVKGVLADHTDGSHGHLHPTAAIVRIHDYQVGFDLVSGDDIPLGHPGQHPNLASILQGTGGFVCNALSQQLVGEAESVLILHHLVAVGHDAQHTAVGASDVGFVTGDPVAIFGADFLLDDLPVKAGPDQSIGGSGGFHNKGAQTVPGLFADVEHGFNIGRHCKFPP